MLGVIFLSLCGITIGIIVSGDIVKRLTNNDYNVIRVFNAIEKFDIPIGLSGGLVGIWNIFSPNFGFKVGITGADITILGALIPSALIILSSVILIVDFILQYINISVEEKERIINLSKEYSDLVGITTLIFSLLHLVTYQTVLL
jgi:predicted small secreted protein